jgi:hypothetical protein
VIRLAPEGPPLNLIPLDVDRLVEFLAAAARR